MSYINSNETGCSGYLVFIVLFLSMLFCSWIYHWTTPSESTITITKMEVKGSAGTYMIFTEGEVFTNEDKWCWLKFDSSDIQGKLKVGGKYDVLLSGRRWPFMSWYRNIKSIGRTVSEPGKVDYESSLLAKRLESIVSNTKLTKEQFKVLMEIEFDKLKSKKQE